MNDDEKPNKGADSEQEQSKDERPAGKVEGAVAEPSSEDVQSMYDDLGIKAKAPSDKSSKRPKTTDSGNKKTAKQDDESGKSKKGRASDDSKKQSKAASASDKDGVDGDEADSKGKKSGKTSGKDGKEDSEVSGNSGEDAEGVSKDESSDNGKTSKAGKEDADEGVDGVGQAADESDSKTKEGEEDGQGKRPGKSNPEIEKRFQKLTGDLKERDQVINDLQKQLREKEQAVNKVKIQHEDPEYTIDDFRKVRDNKTGEIRELDPEQAELAWRRWKDGYNQRASERQAKANKETALAEREETETRRLMQSSADAYDSLTGLMDEYPELVSTSGKFDEDFAAEAMPIIQESIEYAPGTEPGNKDDNLPVIVGLRIDPKKILKALKGISSKKRNLPLNGVNDNVERGSENVSVPHSRSSDPNVNAANELYKELGIKKRI